LILFDFEFIYFRDKVSEEDVLRVFRVLIGEEFFDVIFCDFDIIVLIDAVKDKFEDALVVHETENYNP
jgi:hypothetical protein